MGRAKRAADGGLIYHALNRANGRMVTLTNPDSSTETLTYNTADQVLTTTDELSRVTTYTYDNLDRLLGEEKVSGTKWLTWWQRLVRNRAWDELPMVV